MRDVSNITIKDIAMMAGVSYATVSRALSGSPEVSESTRARVLALCQHVGYTPNVIARSMIKKNTFSIGMILPDISNPFFSEIALHAEDCANAKGYNIFICNSHRDPEKEKNYFQLLASRQVDGIIFHPSSASYAQWEYINRMPTVILGDNLGAVAQNIVRFDNRRGAYLGTRYLIELGHRDIAMLAIKCNSISHHIRLEGFSAAAQEGGARYRVVENPYRTSSIEQGYEIAKKFFSEEKCLPTAIFATTDTMALGVIKAADELGIDIPNDLSLIGYDNIPYSALPKIMLTTIETPKRQLGEEAVNLLIDVIGHKDEPGEMREIVLQPTLMERQTCKRIAP